MAREACLIRGRGSGLQPIVHRIANRPADRRRRNADLSRVILIAPISAFCYGPSHNNKSWEVF
jgi:hypothetical protein